MSHPYLKFPAGPIGAIIHVGAGLCDGLDSYLASAPSQLLLIEPNPQYAAELARKTAAGVVLEQAIAPQKGQAPFHILNFADLSCLKAPDGLRDLLPGIRVVKTPMVETGPLSGILARTPLDRERFNTLVVEAVGEEPAILQDLIDTGHLAAFDQIAVRTGRTAYFAGAGTPDSVKTQLGAQGYRLETLYAEDDPDWPFICFVQDPLMLKNRALQDELTGLKAAAAAELQAVKDKAEQEKTAAAQQIATLQGEVADLRAGLAKAEQDIATARTAAAGELKTAQDKAEQEKTAAAQQIAALQAETARIKPLQDQNQQLETRLDAEATQKADLDTALSEARSREGSALADLRVSVKMQALVRADFEDLQQRYQRLLQEKSDQEDLLSQLTLKLESAAQHLRLMSTDTLDTPVSALDEATKEPVAAPKAAAKKAPKKATAGKTAAKAPRKASRKTPSKTPEKKRSTS